VCSGQIGESLGEKAVIFGGNEEEKGYGEVGTEEVEGKGIYMPRTWLREMMTNGILSLVPWFISFSIW